MDAQTPIFSSESLHFTVADSQCQMTGSYIFKNPGGRRLFTRLYYPFSMVEDSSFPHQIQVNSGADQKALPIAKHAQGISFELMIEAKADQEILVSYTQSIRDQQFRYILMSTWEWGRELDSVHYEIKIPTHLRLNSCSLEIDTTEIWTDHFLHRIERVKFLPLNDLEFTWGSTQ